MSQPTTNPPGGGRWTWDEQNDAWVSLDAPPAAAPTGTTDAQGPAPATPMAAKATPSTPQE